MYFGISDLKEYISIMFLKYKNEGWYCSEINGP